MKRHPLVRLAASFLICIVAGYANLYLFTQSLPRWYGLLLKPAFIPPPIIIFYGIIVVSLLLGLCLFVIWSAIPTHHDAILARNLLIFGIGLSVLWFFVFFSLHMVFIALIIMVLLLAVLAATIFQVLHSAVKAVLILVPFFIVMIIVALANFELYLMNPVL